MKIRSAQIGIKKKWKYSFSSIYGYLVAMWVNGMPTAQALPESQPPPETHISHDERPCPTPIVFRIRAGSFRACVRGRPLTITHYYLGVSVATMRQAKSRGGSS